MMEKYLRPAHVAVCDGPCVCPCVVLGVGIIIITIYQSQFMGRGWDGMAVRWIRSHGAGNNRTNDKQQLERMCFRITIPLVRDWVARVGHRSVGRWCKFIDEA